MPTLCYLEPDLSFIRLLAERDDEQLWLSQLGAEQEPSEEDEVQALRRRAADAAAWTVDRLSGRGRIDLVCVGVAEAVCTWITAPSPEPAVIAAAVNQKGQEWADGGVSASAVQALTAPRRAEAGRAFQRLPLIGRRDRAAGGSPHMAVLNLRDGPLRLWLENVDQRGGRVRMVTTLWHAAATAWSDQPTQQSESNGQPAASDNGENGAAASPQPSAVILAEPGGRLVWAWERGGELVAGGAVSAPAPAETAPEISDEAEIEARCGRLALDWLSWTSHLESAPSRITVLGDEADRLAGRFERIWPESSITAREESDPLGATLRRLGEVSAPSPEDDQDPRRSLVDLSHRPTRAHRRLGLWVCVAVLVFAAAVAGLGWRAQSVRNELLAQREEVQQQLRDRVSEVAPNLADHPSPVRALASHKQTVEERNPPIKQPPAPRPILDELTRLASAMSQTLSDNEDAYVAKIEIDEITANAQVQVPDYATGETLLERLRQSEGRIRWQGTFVGTPPARQRLNGTWQESP